MARVVLPGAAEMKLLRCSTSLLGFVVLVAASGCATSTGVTAAAIQHAQQQDAAEVRLTAAEWQALANGQRSTPTAQHVPSDFRTGAGTKSPNPTVFTEVAAALKGLVKEDNSAPSTTVVEAPTERQTVGRTSNVPEDGFTSPVRASESQQKLQQLLTGTASKVPTPDDEQPVTTDAELVADFNGDAKATGEPLDEQLTAEPTTNSRDISHQATSEATSSKEVDALKVLIGELVSKLNQSAPPATRNSSAAKSEASESHERIRSPVRRSQDTVAETELLKVDVRSAPVDRESAAVEDKETIVALIQHISELETRLEAAESRQTAGVQGTLIGPKPTPSDRHADLRCNCERLLQRLEARLGGESNQRKKVDVGEFDDMSSFDTRPPAPLPTIAEPTPVPDLISQNSATSDAEVRRLVQQLSRLIN